MSNNGTGNTGKDWLDRFLLAQGQCQFEMAWMAFRLGQVGAISQLSDDLDGVNDLIEEIENDLADFTSAAETLNIVVGDMLTNARKNVEERSG